MVHRQAVGDAVGDDGELLFVWQPGPSTILKHGDNSRISRKQYEQTLQLDCFSKQPVPPPRSHSRTIRMMRRSLFQPLPDVSLRNNIFEYIHKKT